MPTPQNYADLTAANKMYEALFMEVFDNPQNEIASNHLAFADTRPITGKTAELINHEALHGWREWIGEKTREVPMISNKSVSLRSYYKAMSVKRLDLRLDNLGVLEGAIRTFLGEQALAVYDKYATEMLVSNSGAGPTGYDGVDVFSATHPRGGTSGGTWSNLTTSALDYATFDTALIGIQGWLDTKGDPKGVFPDTLMVGPKLRKKAQEVTGADELIAVNSSGALHATSSVVAVGKLPNVYGGGQVNVVINPRLNGTQDDYWYLLNSRARNKVVQGWVYRDPEAFSSTDMDEQRRRNIDTFEFDVEADFVFDAGDPHAGYAGIL